MSRLTLEQAFELGLRQQQSGRPAEAEQVYRQILAQYPQHVPSLHMLGVLLSETGHQDEAIPLLRRSVDLLPDRPEPRVNLGLALARVDQLGQAAEAYRAALSLDQRCAPAWANLAEILLAWGKFDDAIAACRRAIELQPGLRESHVFLGKALINKQQWREGAEAIEIGRRLGHPLDARVLVFLAMARFQLRRYEAAAEASREALRLEPDNSDAAVHLFEALRAIGKLDEAQTALDHAIERRPTDAALGSRRLYNLLFQPSVDSSTLLREHQRWDERYAQPIRQQTPHAVELRTGERSAGRRLRIGYVSPDFRMHPLGRNILPLLIHHDREQFEVHCFSSVKQPDALTPRFEAAADRWHRVAEMSDEQLADAVRSEQIDILVDLTMHMPASRLLTFARRPAPVQVTFGAYPGTTGLREMEYRVTDCHLDPPGGSFDEEYTERTIRLPGSFWCYDPEAMAAGLPESPAPRSSRAEVLTFGCLHTEWKMNATVFDLWADVLATIPQARFIVLAGSPTLQRLILERFGARGVSANRVRFVSHQRRDKYLQTYCDIDIVLDTLPYNGHTTSLDALWMGVPVVTLAGPTVVGRAGVSQLTNLRLTELIARSPEQFTAIAARLGNDQDQRRDLQMGLRQRMLESCLCDAKGFVRQIELAYWQMWQCRS
jgi:predicted O-linked N-acetylglucosamine transferase (SPINDLY family)